jgi:hypothetical protein
MVERRVNAIDKRRHQCSNDGHSSHPNQLIAELYYLYIWAKFMIFKHAQQQ